MGLILVDWISTEIQIIIEKNNKIFCNYHIYKWMYQLIGSFFCIDLI